jgi:hypothetical protein
MAHRSINKEQILSIPIRLATVADQSRHKNVTNA